MNRHILLLLIMLPACSDQSAEANTQAAQPAAPEGILVHQPADSLASGHEQILGAIDGPCGAPRAQEFLGQSWTDENSAVMKQRSGAEVLKLFRFNDVADLDEKMNERRLNVYLSPSGRIIHLVCG